MLLKIAIQSICACVILLLSPAAISEDQPSNNTTTASEEVGNPARQSPALNFSRYFTPSEIFSFARNEPLLEWSKIGKTSVEGQDIWLATIRNPEKQQKRSIFIDALMTPCEYHAGSIVMYIMNELLTNSSRYQDILDTTTLHIVPIANPDGYKSNFEFTAKENHVRYRGIELLVKNETFKNSRVHAGSCTGLRSCYGTDIALNFPFQWTALPARPIRNFTYGNPPVTLTEIFDFNDVTSPHYRGTQACSENECQAILNFLKGHKEIDTYVTLHGFINFWAFPYAYQGKKKPENYDELGKLAAAITEAINEHSTETSRYGPFQNMFDLEEHEIFNGKYHPGTPLDYAKSIGIRFTYWAAFGEYNYPRYLQEDILRVCKDAWKGFLVLFRLRDKYDRPLFPPSKSTLLIQSCTLFSISSALSRRFINSSLESNIRATAQMLSLIICNPGLNSCNGWIRCMHPESSFASFYVSFTHRDECSFELVNYGEEATDFTFICIFETDMMGSRHEIPSPRLSNCLLIGWSQ